MNATSKQNWLKVGDRVVYETEEDPNTLTAHYIPGVVIEIVNEKRVIIRNEPGTGEEIEVASDWCELEECDCYRIPAHVEYDLKRGTHAVDEEEYVCPRCRTNH